MRMNTMLVVAVNCCLAAGSLLAAEEVQSVDAATVRAAGINDARFTAVAGSYELRYNSPRDSGVLVAQTKSGSWDWSNWRYLAMDIQNCNPTAQLRLNIFVLAGKDGKQELVAGIALNPQEKRTLRMELPHRERYALPEGIPGPKVLNTEMVRKIEFKLQWAYEQQQTDLVWCEISNLRLEQKLPEKLAAHPKDPKELMPFVDRYGQFRFGEWPQKIHSAADLREKLKQEAQELASAKRIENWGRYGGWLKGPRLQATGSFRTEKYQGKWFFVDPDGLLFFSHGLDVMYPNTDSVNLSKHPEWYENPSDNQGGKQLAHTDLNLRLKYGKADYQNEFYDTLEKRLIAWGFNTIGDWGSRDFLVRDKFPYVLQIAEHDYKNMPRIGESKLKFYDVFDPECIRKMQNLLPDRMEKNPQLKASLTDPYCIGYFIDNEVRFGNWKSREGRTLLTEEVLKSPAQQPAKQQLIRDLQEKYGTIEQLNAAWNTAHASWQALAETTTPPAPGTAFEEDARSFLAKMVDQYYRLCREAIKTYAPARLYLGSRLLSTECTDPAVSAANKKYCDVMTVNIYSHTPANMPSAALLDMPMLIGEFHLGIPDRGMFNAGLCLAGSTQAERAVAYQRFMQGALCHPNIVGAHWFQFRDQPLTGRWDGEGYQIGFVDIADTPYPEMTRASREVMENAYRYRLAGKLVNPMK